MKILIEIDTDTDIHFNLDTNLLTEWFEDEINGQINSMSDDSVEYAHPTVKILGKEVPNES